MQIINDIIDVSKIEAHQLNLTMAECDLNELFSRSHDSFLGSDLLKRKKDVNLVLDLPADSIDHKIIIDKNRLQQVIDNLISNAIKFTDKGDVTFGYRVEVIDGSQVVEVSVRDTGIGIPDEMAGLVFERFRQVEENRFHEGAGLGLSISKGIIELLGGRIWFKSEPGKGTIFQFIIPLVAPAQMVHNQVSTDTSLPDLTGKTVLIAEDDYNSFYYLRLLIEELKANTLHADNGQAVMDLLKVKVPDLILLDINMPVKSGFDCLREIKAAGIKTKIIAQTAYAMPDERERCLSSGCDGYISKPVRKHELIDAIKSVFS